MTPGQLNELDQFRDQAYPIIDTWCRNVMSATGIGCKPGCAECCENIVTVTLIEAAVILRTDEGQKIFQEKNEHIVSLSNLFLRRDPVTRLSPWKKLNEKCPFLGEQNVCEIYSARPFNCRTHLATKPCDPEVGSNHFIDPVEATRAGYGMAEYAKDFTGIPPAVAPFSVALIVADALMRSSPEQVREAYGEVPVLDPMGAAVFWAYIEM